MADNCRASNMQEHLVAAPGSRHRHRCGGGRCPCDCFGADRWVVTEVRCESSGVRTRSCMGTPPLGHSRRLSGTIGNLPCLFPLAFRLLTVHLNSLQYLIGFFARLFLFMSCLVLLRLDLVLIALSCDSVFSLGLGRYSSDVDVGGHDDGFVVVDERLPPARDSAPRTLNFR